MSIFLCSWAPNHPPTYTFGRTSAGLAEKFNSAMKSPPAYFGLSDPRLRGNPPNEARVENGGD